MAYLSLDAVFDLERFRADVDEYCKRNSVSRADLSRITGVSQNTIGNVWQKDVLSLPTAISLAVICDISIDSYVRDGFLEDTDMIAATAVGRQVAPGSRERDRKAAKAKQRAIKKLVEAHRSEYERLVDAERAELGLPPVNRSIPGREAIAAAERSGVEWVDERELTFSDRTDWAYPGQRQLSVETGVSLEEVVARDVKVEQPV